MFAKLVAIRDAWKAGDYYEASKLVHALIGELAGFAPLAMGAEDDCDACIAVCEELMKDDAAPMTMATDETKNPAVIIAILQFALPIILEWLRNRKK